MTTCIPAGRGTLHYRVTDYKGRSCSKAAWVSDVSIKSYLQKDLSCGYVRITTIHRDFPKATLYSFCKITANHRYSGIFTMMPNIG
ncbi:L-aspartate oxidase [Trifolium medium]|uniref:L-aspartate oxidase n=1 Tax=Trifolium medium TaxID=97028 RepID=A0A392MM62_9FABA|nr:L-aspartate oxidase [Trifolium medium]